MWNEQYRNHIEAETINVGFVPCHVNIVSVPRQTSSDPIPPSTDGDSITG